MTETGSIRREQAAGELAEAMLRSASRIFGDISLRVKGIAGDRIGAELVREIDETFLPRLGDYVAEHASDEGLSGAVDSAKRLIEYARRLSDQTRNGTLQPSDADEFQQLWHPFQKEAALFEHLRRRRDPSTGKVRAEFATEDDRKIERLADVSQVFFANLHLRNGKGPTLSELYALLHDSEATKHITWRMLNDDPHLQPLRDLIRD